MTLKHTEPFEERLILRSIGHHIRQAAQCGRRDFGTGQSLPSDPVDASHDTRVHRVVGHTGLFPQRGIERVDWYDHHINRPVVFMSSLRNDFTVGGGEIFVCHKQRLEERVTSVASNRQELIQLTA